MAANKSSGSGRSASTGAVTARAETSNAKNKKSTKTVKHSKTAATAKVGKVAKGGSKKLKSGAGAIKVSPMVEKVPVERVAVEQLRVEKVPVTGRLIKLGAVDRGRARVLEEVITGASEVTITAGPGAGRSTTLTGVLLGVLRTVTDALKHGEAVTIVGKQTQEGLARAVISSQEAADLLNVSRPHVVKLAKTGQLAHHLVGNRHRFALADVLAYGERMRTVRSEALASIAPAGGYTAEDFWRVVEAGDEEVDAPVAPVRPVAVLDANVLIPAGLRDLFLSCADVGVFRPVWQAEIEDEVVRNTARLTVERHGLDPNQARANAEATVVQMRSAFPDGCAATKLWTPLVAQMTCDHKDRHVLAVAVGTEATHLVTTNIRDFPVRSRPAGVAVVKPDRFLRDRLTSEPQLMVAAVEGMCARLKNPPQTPVELARLLAKGQFTPKFGTELLEFLEQS